MHDLRFQAIAELPINLLSPLLFGAAVYWMVGLNPLASCFFIFLGILLLTGFAAIGLGMFIASLAPNAQVLRSSGLCYSFCALFVTFMHLPGGPGVRAYRGGAHDPFRRLLHQCGLTAGVACVASVPEHHAVVLQRSGRERVHGSHLQLLWLVS